MTRRQRVTRVVYGSYVVLVAAFTVSSIVQVARGVFPGTGTAAAAGAQIPKVEPACGKLLEEQIQAIDTARLAANGETNGNAAKARFASERSAARERSAELERACSADPHGTDALAALARLDRSAESEAIRTASELSPVRQAARSFIRGPR